MSSPLPGRALLSWPSLGAALLLALNDFYLKRQHPGWLSGKLSDLALCFFGPIWLYCLLELAWWLRRGRHQARPWPATWPIWLSCAAVGAWMTALQLWPWAAQVHTEALRALMGRRMVVTPDPTDLLSLLVLPLAAWFLVHKRGDAPRG